MGELSVAGAQELRSKDTRWNFAQDMVAQAEPPTDGGRDAWLVLTSSFILGAIVWGMFRSSKYVHMTEPIYMLSVQLRCLPRTLSPSRAVLWFSLWRCCYWYNGTGSSTRL